MIQKFRNNIFKTKTKIAYNNWNRYEQL